VIRTFCRTPLPPAALGLESNSPPDELSCPPAVLGGAAARTLRGEPAGPVTGVATPEAAVGMALSDATGLVPDEESETPAPGEIWLDALSRLLPPLPRPVSISLSSAVT